MEIDSEGEKDTCRRGERTRSRYLAAFLSLAGGGSLPRRICVSVSICTFVLASKYFCTRKASASASASVFVLLYEQASTVLLY